MLLSDLARKVKNIDVGILGRDGKPMKPYRCVKWVDPPSIYVEMEDDTRAGDEWNCVGDASSNGDDGRSTKAGKPVVTNVSPNISQWENEAPLYKLQRKTVKVSSLMNEEKVQGADVAIPIAAIDEICDKFVFTLYGYFIGSRIALPVVENYLIKSKPIVLSIWSANTKMEKEAATKVAVWVKIHNVPVVVFSETGLSLIMSQLGRPLMLDARTSDLCLNPLGRSTYARALLEFFSECSLMDSVVVVVPLPNGSGHTLDTLDVQYEWRPPRCMTCKIFDHETDVCPSRGKKVVSILTLGNGNGKNDGSMGVVLTKRMEGVKQPVKVKQFQGIRFSKPKSKLVYKPVSKPNQVASNISMLNTNDVGDILNKPPEAPLEVITRDNGKSSYIQDDINLDQIKENNDRLMEEDKVLEAIVDLSINRDCGTIQSNKKQVSFTNQSLREDVRRKELGNESDEDEVFLEENNMSTNISSTGRGFTLEEEDLECYDGYEAHSDQYDIRLKGRVRK
ncbi:zinc knuckle CX2CX4HX4C containing protein [Tanacetum coccineum]